MIETTPEIVIPDPYAAMSDRELTEHIARSHDQILTLISGIKDQVQPMIDSIQSNPMLRPFLGGK